MHQLLFMVLQDSQLDSERWSYCQLLLEEQFTLHDLWDRIHKQQAEVAVRAMFEKLYSNCSERVRPCGVQTLIISLKLRTACRIEGISNECLGHFPRRPLVHIGHLLNHRFRLSNFPQPWAEAKLLTLPKPGKDPKLPQYLRLISFLSTTDKFSWKLFEKYSKST